MHPFKKAADKSRTVKAKHMADGGGIDEGIDISTPGPGQYPYGLGQSMSYDQAKKDSEEVSQGKRFFDSGTRIPGRQKGKNDDYDAKLKGRR